jgi:membrane protease YdiL (CAAX protease family)
MRAFAYFLGLFLVAFAVVAVLTYPAWLLLHPHFNFPFHRIGERIGMVVLFVGLVLTSRQLGLTDRASMGYGAPRRVFLREWGLGLVLGAVTMLAIVGLMAGLGVLEWKSTAVFGAGPLAKLIGASLASGVAVALIEETFIRGAMFTAITRESGARIAIVLTSFMYAASHFVASTHIPTAEVGSGSGWTLLAGALHAFARPAAIADAFLALLAVGVVLGLVRAATGNIAACIGLHAGWVWVMLVTHGLTRPASTAPLGFLLSRFDGFVGWLVLAWTVLLALPLRRFYAVRAAASVRTST